MRFNVVTALAYVFIGVAIIFAMWFLILGGYFEGNALKPDPNKAKDIQPFIGGVVLPLLTLGSTLLVVANLRSNMVQNFSNNFFKLIDQHHKLVDNMASAVEGISVEEKPSLKRDFFDDLSNRIAFVYAALAKDPREEPLPDLSETLMTDSTGKQSKELLLCIYDHYFHIHLSDLGHYFRNLFHIIKFVERSALREKQKIEYVKMLRAQLSNYELLLLAYNGLHDYGKEFFPLIEKYELLKNLNNETRVSRDYEKRIVDVAILKQCYPHLSKYWK